MFSVTDPRPFPPCPAPFNLAAHVLGQAERLGSKTALQIVRPAGVERWSYERLLGAVRGVATGLLRAGLVPGDRLMLRLGNGVSFPLAFLGAIAAGLVPVPTAAGLTQPEVTRLAREVAPKLVVAGPGLACPDGPVLTEAELLGFERLPPADWALGDPDRLGYIVFTSGTSGRPRAVAHAHRAVWARRMMHADWIGLGEGDRLLHAGALNWTYTLGVGLLDPWAAGATALVTGAEVTPEQIPLLLRRFDVTIFAAVPGIYRKILARSDTLSLAHLRHGLSAGEKLPQATRAGWRAATGTDLHEAMGLSECSTFISSSPARPAPDGTTGYAQPGRHVAVVDERGAPVPRGTPGILAVAATDPGLCLGFFECGTIRPLTGNWFHTGDIVTMAGDGALTSLGRGDDMLNAGGFRLSPDEIEAAFAACPDAGITAAVELPVKADATVIALFHTGPADEQVLKDWAKDRLAAFKIPRLFIRRDTIPVTANGKINRRELREKWNVIS